MASPDAFLAELRRLGVRYIEFGGWKTRHISAPFTPMAATIHDSVTGTMSDQRAAEFCRDGRIDLLGPLYSMLLGRDGVLRLIAWGATNNSGSTRLDRVQLAWNGAMPLDHELGSPAEVDNYAAANQRHHGIAYTTPGAGPYTAVQRSVMPLVLAALGAAEGWSAEGGARSMIGHGEATKRKRDPELDMGELRRATLAVRQGSTPSNPTGRGFLMALTDAEQSEVLRILRELRVELTNSPVPGEFPGWPERYDLAGNAGSKTLVDYIRALHQATQGGIAGVRNAGHVYVAAYNAQENAAAALAAVNLIDDTITDAEARVVAAFRAAVAEDPDMTDEQAQAAADRIVASIVENTPPQITPEMIEASVRRVFGDAAAADSSVPMPPPTG